MNARTILIAAAFVSMVDRSVQPPLVPVIAADLGSSVDVIAHSLTVYSIAYAALQLVWGGLSTRWGRVRILAVSTSLAGVANVVTALAPDATTYLVARGVSGAAFAATFTAVLIYFGDTLTMSERAVATANLAGAVSLGLALGAVGAGAVAQWWSWRWVFVAIAVACAVLAVVLVRLPEPETTRGERLWVSIGRLARNGWALGVLSLTVLEGFLLVGVFNFLPVALQEEGASVLVAGLVTAAFGVAVIVVSQLMKLVLGRWPAWVLIAGAGAAVAVGYASLSFGATPISVLVAASLMGVAWAFGHTTIQTWMTDAVTNGRAIGMSFFSIALFTGASIGAALGAEASAGVGFTPLFFGAAIAAVVFGIAASIARARYRPHDDRNPRTDGAPSS